MTHSQTANRLSLNNTPPSDVLANLVTTAAGLEQIRTLLSDKIILISSGYRSPEVNAAVWLFLIGALASHL